MTHDDLPANPRQPTPAAAPHDHPKKPAPAKRERTPSFYAWSDEPYDASRGERAMWIAVITQAMMDALSQSPHPDARRSRESAVRWLTENNPDFLLVCLFAGMDPSTVRRKAKKSIAAPVAWRAAPGKGKRYEERKSYRTKKRPADPPKKQSARVINGPWR